MLRKWSEDELREASALAVEHFISARLSEPSRKYEELLATSVSRVESLFELSEDLRALDGAFFAAHPSFLDVSRFLAGPPISQDDLKTLTGVKPPRTSLDSDQARKISHIVLSTIDRLRFPWIVDDRGPTLNEREVAIRWTAGVWAVELMRTWRRSTVSRAQEESVMEMLRGAGYPRVDIEPPKDILPHQIDRIPRGSYSGEIKLDGIKCDVPVRLHDGRILAIECKASNSEVNSIKRLVREVGGKADAWRSGFGNTVVTVAVLSGVFGLRTLVEAQVSHQVFIVWEYDLSPLADHVQV